MLQQKAMKPFKLSADEIKPLVPAMGSCFATDRITVDGALVGYMYREHPKNDLDSGWRFFAGDEDEGYTSDPEKLAMYSINTIANYDPRIIQLLHVQAPVAFALDPRVNEFVAVPFEPQDG